ncbi:jg192, partial [Pararge aegeria aegeria]
MSLPIETTSTTCLSTKNNFDLRWIEQIILELADAFDIQVVWDRETTILTGTLALVGVAVGGYAGGRMGAALGAGIGGAAGFGVSRNAVACTPYMYKSTAYPKIAIKLVYGEKKGEFLPFLAIDLPYTFENIMDNSQ